MSDRNAANCPCCGQGTRSENGAWSCGCSDDICPDCGKCAEHCTCGQSQQTPSV